MEEDRLADIFIFGSIITIVLLKIFGVIKLSWFWLLCPIWGLFLVGFIGAVCLTLICLIESWYHKWMKK